MRRFLVAAVALATVGVLGTACGAPAVAGPAAGLRVYSNGVLTVLGPGAMLVCPLFPGSPAVTFFQGALPCPTVPSGQTTTALTDDVVSYRDPPGVAGTGAGSGGALASSGDAVYPRVGPTDPSGGASVAVLSCTLPAATAALCQAVEADFLVRRAPEGNPAAG